MKHRANLLLLVVVLASLTGCGLGGKWNLAAFEPESAQGNFKFATITFKPTGTYTAEMTYGDQVREVKGTYTYNEASRLITFKAEGHEPRTYYLKKGCCSMVVRSATEPRKWTATLKLDDPDHHH